MNYAEKTIYGSVTQPKYLVGQTAAILALGRPALSYAGLQQQISANACVLQQLGIGRQDRVAVVLPNGPEMAIAFLTVATIATCAPLNPTYTEREFAFYLTDLQAKALIVLQGSSSPALTVARQQQLLIIELCPLLAAAGAFQLIGSTPANTTASPEPALALAQPTDVALLLHTSGTTARPKLVPLTQANLCASATHIEQSLHLTPTDRCLNLMPLFHIHGLVAGLLAPLQAGGSVVCTPGFATEHFFTWLTDFQPSWYTAVPTMHQAILAQAEQQATPCPAHRLRLIRSSSAALPPTVLHKLETYFQVPVIEAYGMTEAAHQMASNPLPPGVRKPGSVGMAAGPVVAIMAAEEERLLAAGAIGEVVIRGANVMAGYLDNAAANTKAFADGWFRTGDQGYLDAQGYLFLTGRLKELINRGGEKIAPREVDEVLLAHPAVAQALTFALPHPHLGETVAAAVVLHQEGAVTESALRTFVAERLAYFKIPARILFLPAIPLGPTGKLQRIGFAERSNLAALLTLAQPKPYVAPRTPLEVKLAELWAASIGVEPIGIHDDFLHLGGDSLAATRIMSRVLQYFGVELTLQAFFAAPTIAELALTILQAKLAENRSTAVTDKE